MGRATVVRVLGAAALVILTAMGLVACTPAGHFTVNSTGDQADAQLNGTCRTSGGVCTLRAALQEANSRSGHNWIDFNIPGSGPHTIAPASQLPRLTDAAGATIDGYTEPDSAENTNGQASNAVLRIELRGPGRTSGIDGIDLRSPGNVVRGLAVWNFREQIRMFGTSAHHNELLGNFIGTNAAATVGAPSLATGSMGVHLQAGANNNRIGKPGNAHRNVISGNYQHGIAMYEDRTDFNLIQNNIIGLRPNGQAALPNRSHGIDLNTFAADNLVGGDSAGERNVVSGNGGDGIEVSHGSGTVRNNIIGNLIGTAPNGTSAPAYAANGSHGVQLEGVGNPDAECTSTCPADAGLSTVRNNVIVNNLGHGILIHTGNHDNVVTDNRIGELPNGTAARNRGAGVQMERGAFGNDIGPGNVIARNATGVVVVPSSASSPAVPTNRNTITRNVIRNNSGLGIDLAPTGAVTQNPSSLVNNSVDIPRNVSVTASQVTYATCPGCRVEVFISDGGAGAFGEGAQFVGSDTADSSGQAVVPLPEEAQGRVLTATATDSTGSTSEFSQGVSSK